MTALELYNAHKRRTLDRLSNKYQIQIREIIRRELDSQASAIRYALDSGAKSYRPPVSKLKADFEFLFEKHRADVIRVGVSDGIQEISPDKRLALWTGHPISAPVEDTLGVILTKKRDSLTPQIAKKVGKRKPERPSVSAATQLDTYLSTVKDTYRRLAGDWLQGSEDSTIRTVLDALSYTLRKNDYEAARIFRTETTAYFNESRYYYFSDNTDADYIELFAVTDGRISQICKDRHGFVVTMGQGHLKKYMPPFHPHCRTVQRPLISYLPSHKLIIERGLAMNESSFTPLPKGWAA